MEFGRFVGRVLLLACLSLFSCSTEGYRFYVGGRDGWVVSPSEDYSHWAERNRFQVNDTLFFKYKNGSDSVLEVNKDDFLNCNTNNPIKKLDGGNSEFTFNRSGPYYFISGQNGNCAKGQKLVIVVMAVRHHKQPTLPPPAMPPSAAPSPSTPTTPSPGGPKPPSPSPSPVVYNPPAATPAPWSSPSMSPVPAPSTGTTPPTTSPASPPTTSPASPPTTPPSSPPTPAGPKPPTPSAEPPVPSPPGTVVTAPPPGSENSTAPVPPGSGGVRATCSSVWVSWAVVLVSVALMSSSFVQAGAA